MTATKKNYFTASLIVIVLFFLTLLVITLYDSTLIWDEAAYLGNARSYLRESYFQEDFRFPALEWFVAIMWFVTGESVFVAKFLVVLFSVGSVYLFYRIAQKYFDEKDVLFATVLFALCPLFLTWGYRVYADVPGLFFITAALYSVVECKEGGRREAALLFGIGALCALAFLMRFPLALFGASVGLAYLLRNRWKDFAWFVLGVFVVTAPWMYHNYLRYGNPLWDLMEQVTVVALYTSPEPAILQFQNLFLTMGALAVFVPIGLYFLWGRRYQESQKRSVGDLVILISCVSFFIYYFFFVNLKPSRYYLAALSPLYIAAYVGFLWVVNKINKKMVRNTVYAAVIAIALVIFVINAGIVYTMASCNRDGALMQSVNYVVDHTDEGDNVLSNFWPYFGYYGNLRVHHFYTPNVNELLTQYEPKYAIFGTLIGADFDKKLLDANEALVLEKTINDSCGVAVSVYKVENG